jgi:Fic family protein
VEFLLIHPFLDGNGRLSRILTNLLLLQSGYSYVPYVSHEKLIEDQKTDYYLSLRKTQKTLRTGKPEISAWMDFFLKILLKQADMALALLTSEQIEKLLSEKQLVVWGCFQKGHELSPREILKKTKIARPTVNQILRKLLELKKIEKIGLGRSTRYRKIEN